MPRLTDLMRVGEMLDRDRPWAAYAIGDLAPGFVEHCEWHAARDGSDALVLVYRGFTPPIAFAMGDPGDLRPIFNEIDAPDVSLQVRHGALDAMSADYAPIYTRAMRRMVVRPETFRPVKHGDVHVVRENDLTSVKALYDDGHRRDEGPAFFHAPMLRQNTFRGIWEDGALVAIAGTHVYSEAFGVCAIGNVYTRSDRRGRGLAARVTSAVVGLALEQGVSTIVLNVSEVNGAAQRVYERLGFARYCDFIEGEARRLRPPSMDSQA